MKEETHKSHKELQKNTNLQLKDLSKTIQDLNTEVETMKTLQWETRVKIEKLGKKSWAIDANIINRIQEIEEIISDGEETIESMDSTVKENAKCKKVVTQNIQETEETL